MHVVRLAVAVTVVVAGCSGDQAVTTEGPPPSPASSITSMPAPDGMSVVGHRSVGTGRGLAAAASPGVTVVVTGAGVFSATPGAVEPTRLGTFDEPVGNVDVAVSPDGLSAAVVVGHPAGVRFYDLSGARAERIVPFEDGQVSTVTYTADGHAVAQGPQSLVAWPAGPDATPVTLAEGTTLGRGAVLADGRFVAPEPGTGNLWVGPPGGPLEPVAVAGIGDGTLVEVHAAQSGVAVSVARGADEFSRTDDIVLVDPASWRATATVAAGGRTERTSWALSDSGVAIAGADGTALYDLTGSPLAVRAGPATSVYAATTGFVTLADDATLAVWDPDELPTPVATAAAPQQPSAVSVANGTVSVVGFDGDVGVWDASTGAEVLTADAFATGELTSVAVAADGRVAAGSTAGTAVVYDRELRPLAVVDEGGRRIDSVAFTPGDGDLVTALAERVGDFAFDDSVARWGGDSLEERFRITGAGQDVAGCAFFYNRARFSPDGSLLAIVRHTFEVSLVDPATGSVVHTFAPHGGTVLDIAFDGAGHLVTTADDATVRVWRLDDYSSVAEYAAAPGGYTSIAMLGGGAMAVTALFGNITVIDVVTGEARGDLPVSGTRDGRPAASPSGALLAVPALDGSVGVWSMQTRSLLVTMRGPAALVNELLFVDDTTVVGASDDGTLHEWQLASA